MKQLKLIGFLGAAVIALAFFVTSCSKKSGSSGTSVGTVTFTVNGKPQTFAAVADSMGDNVGNGLSINQVHIMYITAVGVLAGTHDTATLNLNIGDSTLFYTSFMGYYADTSLQRACAAAYVDQNLNAVYGDAWYMTDFLTATITSNKGGVVSGTFQGTLPFDYAITGSSASPSAPDSVQITNGKFSVKF